MTVTEGAGLAAREDSPLPAGLVRMGNDVVAEGDDLALVFEPVNRRKIESWLAALLQVEHEALLIGNGLSAAIAGSLGSTFPPTMNRHVELKNEEHGAALRAHASRAASNTHREPNLEDEIRSALALLEGVKVLGRDAAAASLQEDIDSVFTDLMAEVSAFERDLKLKMERPDRAAWESKKLLQRFLAPFSTREAGRDRLNLYTTNYDRLLEYSADLMGLRLIDRFVGTLEPRFSSSRLDIDMTYSPPGLRGEPRYLEGVIRYSKLHGSLDWRYSKGEVVRAPVAFGSTDAIPEKPSEAVAIYPNPAKDVETLAYPYAELFRDFAASICRPNSVLFTYGYGYGDSHINRIISDMLRIPSTHLVVISRDNSKTIESFVQTYCPTGQTTMLIGHEVGSLDDIVRLLPSGVSEELLDAQYRASMRMGSLQDESDEGSALL
ncbi:SIR2 family protein [Arthrobacter sp. MDT2-2]